MGNYPSNCKVSVAESELKSVPQGTASLEQGPHSQFFYFVLILKILNPNPGIDLNFS
jgi:hypothetical protein